MAVCYACDVSAPGMNVRRAFGVAIGVCICLVALDWFVDALAFGLELLHFVNQAGATALNTVSAFGRAAIGVVAVQLYFSRNLVAAVDAGVLLTTCGVVLVATHLVETGLPWTSHDIRFILAVMIGATVICFLSRWLAQMVND